jgi:signal transduction histidine kinase/ActR/RegA family two-component response regulator
MTIDPQVLRSEQHLEIGRLLQRDTDVLIERWSRRAVQEQPHAARAHHQALVDHLHVLLKRLGDCLSDTSPDACPHCAPATEHGEQRWEEGWSLPEVVRDYQILRLVIFDHLEEALERPPLFREVQAIGLVLDEAITASVASYVRQRDEYVRQVEQERAGQQRQAAESLRAQAEALRESDRRKNEFLAVLAHELRNPLAPILSAVEVLRLLGPGDPGLAEARDIVERQARQMARLVDDLLDMARIAQGKLELRRTAFDLAAALTQAVQTVTPLIEAQGHQLSVALPAEPLRLEGDQARVVQVIVNLLHNAGKYTERGGRIHLTGSRAGDEVVVRVRDNGIGIEPEMLGRVFDLFTQVDRSLPHAQGGLGIGLMLVRQLVGLHGGRVAAHSDGPGRGSEFTVWLPALPPARDEAPAGADQGKQAQGGRHILIIEDNADTRSTLQTLLTLKGHRVEVAATGPEGITAALASRPQVALIDLGLPGADGTEVGRKLRAELGGGVLLVALTGHALEEDRRRTREAGFNVHLVKPVEWEELTALLADPLTAPGAANRPDDASGNGGSGPPPP